MILGGRLPGKVGDAGFYSSLAQPVEHAAVNRRVVGSSPTRGAIKERPNGYNLRRSFFIA